MILKKIFNPFAVVRYMWKEMLLSLLPAILVYAATQIPGGEAFRLPFSVPAILGSALAIFIAFRNNNAYGRWWEARTIWGGIINSSRVLARLVRTFADSHRNQPNYDSARSEAFKTHLILMQIAWAHSLRLHLRKQNDWHILKPFLQESDFQALSKVANKPAFLQVLMGNRIYDAMANGVLGGFDSFQMEGQLLALAQFQGGCERIKNTPLLRQYHFFTQLFLLVFMWVLPLGLIADFEKLGHSAWVVPVSFLISFVFGVMGKVGEVNEDPFEGRETDVPLTALCITIERDLKETLGWSELPPPAEPQNGFLF